MYIHPSIHVYTPINTCIYIHQHMYIHPATHVYTSTNTCIYTHQHMYIHPPTHVYTPSNTCIYIHQHMYIHPPIHVYITVYPATHVYKPINTNYKTRNTHNAHTKNKLSPIFWHFPSSLTPTSFEHIHICANHVTTPFSCQLVIWAKV